MLKTFYKMWFAWKDHSEVIKGMEPKLKKLPNHTAKILNAGLNIGWNIV